MSCNFENKTSSSSVLPADRPDVVCAACHRAGLVLSVPSYTVVVSDGSPDHSDTRTVNNSSINDTSGLNIKLI